VGNDVTRSLRYSINVTLDGCVAHAAFEPDVTALPDTPQTCSAGSSDRGCTLSVVTHDEEHNETSVGAPPMIDKQREFGWLVRRGSRTRKRVGSEARQARSLAVEVRRPAGRDLLSNRTARFDRPPQMRERSRTAHS
jgi:hypothetical protein